MKSQAAGEDALLLLALALAVELLPPLSKVMELGWKLAKEGPRLRSISRYLTLALAILNSVGYLFLFKSFGISFQWRRRSRRSSSLTS